MEFYPIHKDREQLFNEIRRRIFRLQNGKGLDSMIRIGADVHGQIGASYVSLKMLSQHYSKNLELALRLWGTQQREEQIMAYFLLPIDVITQEKMTQLLQTCHSFEIAEYGGTLLIAARKDIKEIVEKFLDADHPFLQIAALTAIAKERITRKSGTIFPSEYIRKIEGRAWADPYIKRVFERIRMDINE